MRADTASGRAVLAAAAGRQPLPVAGCPSGLRVAWALAGLTLFLAAALIPLSLATHQNPLATGGANIVIALSFAGVGLVVAWHRPRNPIGWLMLVLAAVSLLFYTDSGLYNVFDYRLGHRLPLAPVVLVLYHASQPVLGLIPLAILLFPDGGCPRHGGAGWWAAISRSPWPT